MKTFDLEDVRLEDLVRGPLFIAETAAAWANKTIMERHFMVEWNSDIDATMATIHPDKPWQRIPALGVDVNGVDAVRTYYLERFSSWPGPAMDFFDRAAVTDTCIYVEGQLQIKPKGDFCGVDMKEKSLSAPAVIVVDCLKGLILGETIYVDGAALLGRSASRVRQ